MTSLWCLARCCFALVRQGAVGFFSPVTSPPAPHCGRLDEALFALTTQAYDFAGNVTPSAPVGVTSNNVDTTPPAAPSGLTASGLRRRISLSWTASTDNVGVTGYQVYRSSSAAGPFSQLATTTSTTYVDTGLASGAKWYYYVTATDAAGNVSAPSSTVNATTR